MKDLEQLEQEYNQLLHHYDEVKSIEFINELIKHTEKEFLKFHFNTLKDQSNEPLFYELRGEFYRHGETVKPFLLDKLENEADKSLQAEALFILGTLDDLNDIDKEIIKKSAKQFIENYTDYKHQYYGIIVLGWIGGKDEIPILENQMINNDNPELRAIAATAIRQIYFQNKRLSKSILNSYLKALSTETNSHVIGVIIVCIQDIEKRKFGLQELRDGRIKGDVSKAKEKVLKFVDKQ